MSAKLSAVKQAKPFCGLSVQRVADDGAPDTGGMGTMDTQLMGAAGERMKLHECTAKVVSGQQATFRHGRTSVDAGDNLTRAVQRIGTKGKVDCERLPLRNGRG